VRAILIDAMDERARVLYARFDFEPSPVGALEILLLLEGIR
jgi:hypothetical protein